jgi:NAD(P)-dependent dehydrogenase (short-subunit alcohol dehydrogenase family)
MFNPFTLKGKTILVTGASSGIGKSIAIESSKFGANVIITGRSIERLRNTFSLLEGNENRIIDADLSKKEDLKKLYDNLPILDGMVNCAGLTIPKPFKFISEQDFAKIMNINFEAPLYLTQTIVKKKKMRIGSSIVFISSISGVKVSYLGGSIYSASKGAINGLCKGLALEFAPNIRVNTVIPGMIETNILSGGQISEDQLVEDMKNYPLKRYGKPEEVAYAVIYLLSDAASWTTGSNILIDGGYTLK